MLCRCAVQHRGVHERLWPQWKHLRGCICAIAWVQWDCAGTTDAKNPVRRALLSCVPDAAYDWYQYSASIRQLVSPCTCLSSCLHAAATVTLPVGADLAVWLLDPPPPIPMSCLLAGASRMWHGSPTGCLLLPSTSRPLDLGMLAQKVCCCMSIASGNVQSACVFSVCWRLGPTTVECALYNPDMTLLPPSIEKALLGPDIRDEGPLPGPR